MGPNEQNFEIFMNGKKFEIYDFENEVIKIDQSKEMIKPITKIKAEIKVNIHDMEMALYKLTGDMSIFYRRSYPRNMRMLWSVYEF